MCSRIECARCGKPSFAGCGRHVEQVLRDVAPADRCACHKQPRQSQPSAPRKRPSWLQKLLE